jgi:hypothetical protein
MISVGACARAVTVAFVLMVALPAAPARADEASAYQQKATAAFALGEYKEAAENFERAFKLHPDPALLYNAAQSHRLGGNKERALTLYENYLRVYGKKNSRAEEVQKHIDNLKAAIERDKSVTTSPPPASSSSVNAAPAKAASTTPPPATATPRPTTATTAPPPATAAPKPATAPTAPPPATATPRPATATPTPATAPTAPLPATLRPAPVSPAAVTTAPPPATTAPVLVAQPAAKTSDDGSAGHSPWLWIAIGGGVAAAAVVAILLASSGSAKDPSPSLGTINGYPQ